ncbi:MAG: site-specific integrase [Candidatus Binatia bacterium]
MPTTEALPQTTPDHPDTTALVHLKRLPRDQHPAAVYLARLAPGSRPTMTDALDRIAAMLTGNRCNRWTLRWDQIRYQHTQAVRSKLADKYEPATANKMLSALRGVLKEAWRLGQVDAENYHRAVDLPSVRGESPLRGRALTPGELRKIAAVCAEDLSPAGPRDAAMIALSTVGGLRRSEIINLDVKDYDPENGALTIRRGKGRKPRICYATNGAADALADWLQLRGSDAGALFWGLRHMIGHAFHVICAKRARQAGVKAFTPHDGRRTFISDLLDAGADISLVQRLAGHANVTTTARYDRRPEEAKKRAASLLHFPYVRRTAG